MNQAYGRARIIQEDINSDAGAPGTPDFPHVAKNVAATACCLGDIPGKIHVAKCILGIVTT